MKRGFTLYEMMIVAALSSSVFAAAGLFYYQARLSAARVEAQVQLQRQASLAAEFLARDLRSARSVQAVEGGLDLALPEDIKVAYRISPGQGLIRAAGGRVMKLSARITELQHQAQKREHTVTLQLVRTFSKRRKLQLSRTIQVRRR